MSRKRTTRKAPLKADLLSALRGFTDAIRDAGGIYVVTGEPGPRRRGLDSAYRRACALLGEQAAPITKESADDYHEQAAHLLNKHSRLVELAQKRGYSTKACVGLVMSAAMAENVKALPFR